MDALRPLGLEQHRTEKEKVGDETLDIHVADHVIIQDPSVPKTHQ